MCSFDPAKGGPPPKADAPREHALGGKAIRIQFFDSHTHAQFSAFAADYKEVVRRALLGGTGMVNIGTQRDTSRWAVEIAHEFENEPIYAAVGLHPIHAEKSFHDPEELGTFSHSQECENKGFTSRGEEFDYDYYKKLAEDPKVVAIGECGLDYYHLANSKEQMANSREIIARQKSVFLKQIELAHEIKKPLMIHCREAFGDLIKILNTSYKLLNTPPGIIHFFTGTVEEAKKLLDLGFYFTFGGAITFPFKAGAPYYDEIIKTVPLERILSETDAPYVAPIPYRGKRNEPAYVIEVVKKLAEIKEISLEKMAGQIWENTKITFRLPS